ASVTPDLLHVSETECVIREVKQRFDMARKELKYHPAAINRRQSRLRKRQHRLRNVKRGGELTCSSTKLQSNICCKRFQAPLMHATIDVHRLNTFEHLFKTVPQFRTAARLGKHQHIFQVTLSNSATLTCNLTLFNISIVHLLSADTIGELTAIRDTVDDSLQGKESVRFS
ncbi:hypothetical protein HID58_064834, partial [Brassica napus]